MKIAILGAGSLGCYYGAMLSQVGFDVSFIMRSAYAEAKDHGLFVRSEGGDIALPDAQLFDSPESCGPVDLIFVCWKSTANAYLKSALPPLLHEKTRVVTLQNGMGNAEAIAELVDSSRVFIGLCYICAMLEGPGRVLHTGPNDVRVAPFVPTEQGLAESQEISDYFSKAGIKSRAMLHAEQALWGKLSWNIPFNGLCLAHGGICIEELFAMPSEVVRARLIMNEVCACAAARGFAPNPDLVESQMARTAKMTTFIPSSALDYLNGRAVEYDAIWGIPLQRAQAVGAQVPYWEALAADIRKRLAID